MPTPEEIEAAKKAEEERLKAAKEGASSDLKLEEMVTGAVRAHTAKAVRDALAGLNLNDAISKALAPALTPIQEQLAKLQQGTTEPPEGGKKKEDPEFVALKKRQETSDATISKLQAELDAATGRARDEKARAFMRKATTGKVVAGREDDLIDLLLFRKQLNVGDDGSVTLTHRTKLAAGHPEDDHVFPYEEGLGHLLKTDWGQQWVPAPTAPATAGGVRAAGGRPPIPGPGGVIPGTNGQPAYDRKNATEAQRIQVANQRAAQMAQVAAQRGLGSTER